MGHAQLETSMVYLHLTNKGQENAFGIISNFKGEKETYFIKEQ